MAVHATCRRCGAVYDVSDLAPLSRFACEGCGAALVVPRRKGRPRSLLFGAAAVLLVGGAAAAFLLRGRAATGRGPDRPAAESLAARRARLQAAAEASGEADDWFRLGRFLEEEAGDGQAAQRVYKHIVRHLDPDHAEARKRLGYVRYAGPIEKFRRLKWLTPAELALARKAEAARAAAARRRAEDPWLQAAEKAAAALRADRHLKRFRVVFGYHRPFLIAKERRNPSTDRDKLRRLGELLQAAARDFRATLASLGLPPLDRPQGERGVQVLPVLSFETRLSFDRYHESRGLRIPQAVAAYFNPATGRILYFEGSLEAAAHTGGGGHAFVSPEEENRNKLVHELVHQLMWFYASPRRPSRLHWFQEGWAEFFSGTTPHPVTRPDGTRGYRYTFRGKLRARMAELKHCRIRHWFTFADLMAIADAAHLHRLCARKADGDAEGIRACQSLFYAEAWSLVYFLWHYRDGVYRERLLRYVGFELQGKTGRRYFRQAFRGVDLHKVAREWRAFVDATGPFLKGV